MIDYLCDVGELNLEDRLEYYCNIIRYHDRWEELTAADFEEIELWRKGASLYNPYLSKQKDLSSVYRMTDETTELSDKLTKCIESLFDYCQKEDLKVLFVTVPQARETIEEVKAYNTFNRMAAERGFPTLDLLNGVDVLNLDLTQDFYNEEHTNVHGSLKFTHYLSQYLMEHFGLQDKHNDENYRHWEEAFTRYYRTTSIFTLPFELDPNSHAYELPMAEGQSATTANGQVNLSWQDVPDAEGYTVFRKGPSIPWKEIGTTADTVYTDTDCNAGTEYQYIVVPYITQDNQTLYGNFPTIAVKAKP